MADEIVLYDYWRSSASYRLRIALESLGLSYKRVSVDLLAGEQRAPEHRARNPQGLVPALAIDGQTLTRRIGRRAVSPRRARTLASRLMSLHEAMSSASGDVPQVPDGWSGWYRLAAKG